MRDGELNRISEWLRREMAAQERVFDLSPTATLGTGYAFGPARIAQREVQQRMGIALAIAYASDHDVRVALLHFRNLAEVQQPALFS